MTGENATSGATTRGSAAPELIGLSVFALVVMGLLATGYSKSGNAVATAQANPPATRMSTPAAQTPAQNAGSGQTTGMAQPAGSSEQPKNYQPVNPAPDGRNVPTSSNTGVGAENGSTGQPQGTNAKPAQ